jgi:hypothetical protein
MQILRRNNSELKIFAIKKALGSPRAFVLFLKIK